MTLERNTSNVLADAVIGATRRLAVTVDEAVLAIGLNDPSCLNEKQLADRLELDETARIRAIELVAILGELTLLVGPEPMHVRSWFLSPHRTFKPNPFAFVVAGRGGEVLQYLRGANAGGGT